MHIEIFTVCEFAEQSKRGNFSIKNTRDTWLVHKVPAELDQSYIALRVRFSNEEAGEHVVKLRVVDPDGRIIFSTDGSSPFQISSYEDSGTLNLVFRLEKIPVTTFGRHSVVMSINGNELGDLPLHVRKTRTQ